MKRHRYIYAMTALLPVHLVMTGCAYQDNGQVAKFILDFARSGLAALLL